MNVHDKDTTTPEMPLKTGEICGHDDRRAEIVWLPESIKHSKLLIRYLDTGKLDLVWATTLHDAPPVPEHIEQAAKEAVDAGIFSDPRSAVFGKGN